MKPAFILRVALFLLSAASVGIAGPIIELLGHVKHFDFKYLTEPSTATQIDTNPSNSTYGETVQTWNRPDVIWNPLGATTEE